MTSDRGLGIPRLGLIPRPKLGLQTPMGAGRAWFLSRRGTGSGEASPEAGTGLAASEGEERPNGPWRLRFGGQGNEGGDSRS